MSSEPAKGLLERSVWEKAQSLSVAGLLSIPVIFATVPAILFKVAAERQGDAADAFRAFAFAYFAFPLGYLVLRGLRVRVVVRVVVALLIGALALKLSAPVALLAALLVLAGLAAVWVAVERMRGRPSRVVARGQAVWRSRHRWRTRDWWWAAAPVIPLLLLFVVLLAGAALVSSAERAAEGYDNLFATSRDIVTLDEALGTPGGRPGRADSSTVRYAPVKDSAARANLHGEILCATQDYAAAVDALVDSTQLPKPVPSRQPTTATRRDSVAQREVSRSSAGRARSDSAAVRPRQDSAGSTSSRVPIGRAPVRQDTTAAGADSVGRGVAKVLTGAAAQSGASGCPPRHTTSQPVDSLAERVHRAWVRLDSLIGHAAAAPDTLSRQVDAIQLAASQQITKLRQLPDIAVLDQDAERFHKLQLLRSTLNEARAVETREDRQKADSVRQLLSAHQAGRLANARDNLARSYEHIRSAYIRLFAAAMVLLAAGLWIARWRQARTRRRASRLAAVSPHASKSSDTEAAPPSREGVLADTYLLGLALVMLLGLPLLPKLDPANLDPRHPGRMFVQPGWYLPSFVAQQATPIRETPPVQPGEGQVVNIYRTEPPGESVKPPPPPPPIDSVRLDSVTVRLDSMLAVMRRIEARPTTVIVVSPAVTPAQPGRDTLWRILKRLSDNVDSVRRQVRTRPSRP